VKVGFSNIFEAKTEANMMASFPQLVAAMATWCRANRKSCTRGAVTCGEKWIFFAYEAQGESNGSPGDSFGGRFARTNTFQIGHGLEDLDLIVGILMDWIENPEDVGMEFFEAV